MRTPRSRLSKGFSLEKRLIDCEQALELYPGVWRGKWNRWGYGKPYQRIILDLGCGKGEYTVACAKLHPDTLFIGLDIEVICAIRGAERAKDSKCSIRLCKGPRFNRTFRSRRTQRYPPQLSHSLPKKETSAAAPNLPRSPHNVPQRSCTKSLRSFEN